MTISLSGYYSAGQGGVPALFKSFSAQAGLPYEVYLETEPGVGIDWHLERKLEVIGQFLRTQNARADIRIMATWPRADQVYLPKGARYGKPIEAMARDVRDGYDRAAAGITVVPVGDAWVRAMHTGVADSRSLGTKERSGFELGLSGAQVSALQQLAFDQLAAEGTLHKASQ